MIVRPSPIIFGLEGSKEVIEQNIIDLVKLYEDGVIEKKVFDKMLKVITSNKNL